MKTETIVLIGLAAFAVMLYMRKKTVAQPQVGNQVAGSTGAVQTASGAAISTIIGSAGDAVSSFIDGL
jgi:hypothetical protein